MRIPIIPNRETLLSIAQQDLCQLYYPDWEILLSQLDPYSPNEDTGLNISRSTQIFMTFYDS